MSWIGLRLSPRTSPTKGEQLVRYYGYYSNVSRGKRKKQKPEEKTEIRPIDASPVSRELKSAGPPFFRIMGPRQNWMLLVGRAGIVLKRGEL
jgi:hypothetical protein